MGDCFPQVSLLDGKNKMNTIDILVQNYISLARTPNLTELMYLLTIFFNVSIYTFYIFILITLLVALASGVKHALLFLSTTFFTANLVYLLKDCFGILRPEDSVVYTFGHSFPSFHATMATVFFVMLMYIFDEHLRPFLRVIFNSISIFAIFAVAFSRVYLGAHWFSDVFFGVILGALVSYFFIIIFRFVINMRGATSMVK